MAQTLAHLLGQFTINSSNDSFSIGATAKTVENRTTYFIAAYADENPSPGLMHQISVLCKQVDAGASCTYDFTTGKVTLAFSEITAVTWTDAALGVILGFPANLSGASSYVGTTQPRYVWRPQRGSLVPAYPNAVNFWSTSSNSLLRVSRDGTAHSVQGSLLYNAEVQFPLLPVEDVLTPTTGTVYQDLQQFYSDCIHTGRPIRVFPDRTVRTSTGYVTALVGNPKGDSLGSFSDFAKRHIANFNGLWNVTLPMVKYV